MSIDVFSWKRQEKRIDEFKRMVHTKQRYLINCVTWLGWSIDKKPMDTDKLFESLKDIEKHCAEIRQKLNEL
jgi:hypothetical protein